LYQISVASPAYDKLEKNAPSFDERVKLIGVLSKTVGRVMVRIQPYIMQFHESILQSLKLFSDQGAYGVVVEALKLNSRREGLEKVTGDWVYPLGRLRIKFQEIKESCQSLGLQFYSGENRLRSMGVSTNCCGTDGLPDFVGNMANANALLAGGEITFTDQMTKVGTGYAMKAIIQTSLMVAVLRENSYKTMMEHFLSLPIYKNLVG
jgi:hypothetical protein